MRLAALQMRSTDVLLCDGGLQRLQGQDCASDDVQGGRPLTTLRFWGRPEEARAEREQRDLGYTFSR